MELDNILNYLGCDAEIYLDKELERVFKNMPETEELFLMRIGNTLWDFVRKRTGKDCPCCMSDELNSVLAPVQQVNLIEVFPVAHLHDFRFEILHSCVRAAVLAALPCVGWSFHVGQ